MPSLVGGNYDFVLSAGATCVQAMSCRADEVVGFINHVAPRR